MHTYPKVPRLRARNGQETRSQMLRITATPTEKNIVKTLASATGMSESDYMRQAIQKAIEEDQWILDKA